MAITMLVENILNRAGFYKKEPQPKDPQYLYIWEMAGVIYLTKHKHEGKNYAFIGKIKLEVDDE